ncbi:hypothetical protein [Nocardia aurantia]|uniref:Uncharacterized protein n=1 Tax=Nocardia aurantia TaxID=2585199 RepID=A0A7K0DRB0_9NOCA|nr:hypothetical protein [Nocardia aurantia]MQY27912.1 hypothetical protein [Nocardia aurantia]
MSSPPESGSPDVALRLDAGADGARRADAVTRGPAADGFEAAFTRALAEGGPLGWDRVEAVIAMTVSTGTGIVTYLDPDSRPCVAEPSAALMSSARAHRLECGRNGSAPWWRLIVRSDRRGATVIEPDHGDEPFPDHHLFAAETYLEDLRVFPRDRLPVWLAAYLTHGGRQHRSPGEAAAAARARESAGPAADPVPGLPPLPRVWARWAIISATFAAIGSPAGPRMMPALAHFEGSGHSGSTLHLLPGDRAVLSGGVWNSPELDAVYNDGAVMPDFYAGAPRWVANPVLNPRAALGTLSFCYWWHDGRWFAGRSPAPAEVYPAMPGIWSAETTTQVLTGLLGGDRGRAALLVDAVESGTVTEDLLGRGYGPHCEIDAAAYQLTVAGVDRRGA